MPSGKLKIWPIEYKQDTKYEGTIIIWSITCTYNKKHGVEKYFFAEWWSIYAWSDNLHACEEIIIYI
jgi:hypothetical protein